MLSLAGQPLLIPDEGGELSRWLADNQDLRDLLQFGHAPMSDFATQRESRMKDKEQIGLPWYNWKQAPEPRLNTLYWPTGASRWAQGWFLATKEAKEAIVTASSSLASAVTLKMGDDAAPRTGRSPGGSVECSVYVLAPRPVSGHSEELWLLPVVDARYWWQFKDSGDWPVESTTTWADMFTALSLELGETVAYDEISTCYLKPDPTELTRRYYNPAVLLDAVSSCIGQRIVRLLDGTVKSVNAESAESEIASNLDQDSVSEPWSTIAGDDFSDNAAGTPKTVRVTFPKYSSDAATYVDGERYYIDKDNHNSLIGVPDDTRKLIRCSAKADFSSGGSLPSNWQELDNLACWIAYDFYRWHGRRFDYTFAGIKTWVPTGFEDAILYEFGRPRDGGGWYAKTRVQSVPAAVGVESQLSQTTNLSSTTTTSSTSSGTYIAPGGCDMTPCGCVHTWNDLGGGDGEWTRPPGTPCSGTTTSSTTSGDCQCPVPQTTSTSSTSTTSGCDCLWPTFCGTIDGQVAYTSCSTVPNNPPNCSSTTTTSTTSPTCDCTDNCSSKSCIWEFTGYGVGGEYRFNLVSSECEPNCGPCAEPTTCPSGRYSTTYCSTTSATTPTDCECYPSWSTWKWNPVTNDWDMIELCNSFTGTTGSLTFYTCCTATKPTGTGTLCEERRTLCYKSTNQASSTTDPCYKYCHSTTSTSTTTNPCVTGSCLYQATHDTTAWVRLSTTCPASCQCTGPTYTGCPDELVKVPCGSTTTTSTTSIQCELRSCQFECQLVGGQTDAPWYAGSTKVAWYVTAKQCGNIGDVINGDPGTAFYQCCCSGPGAGSCASLSDVGNVTTGGCYSDSASGTCSNTTTSSTTTTSTTTAGCNAECNYQCLGGLWTLIGTGCPAGCGCTVGVTPGGACTGSGVEAGICGTTSTTTTTTTTTTSSSTSTTTTSTTSGII